MKEELKRETEEQITAFYDVYKTSTGLYVIEDLCKEFNIGNSSSNKVIRDNTCYQVTEEDLKTIDEESANQKVRLIPNIVTIFDLQLVLSFTVYVDINHDRKIYISDSTCARYNITPQSKRMINGATFCNVTENDLIKIENQSVNENVRLKRNYIDIALEDEIKPAEYLFIYYFDYETKKQYVRRDMFELFRNSGIEIEGNPKIIDDKNCYSITDNELKEVEQTIHYRGVEQILKPNLDLFPIQKKIEIPSDEAIQAIVDQIYAFKERENLFKQVKTYDDTKVKDDIRPYLDRIMPVLGDDDIIKPVIEQLEDDETILIYQDKKNNRLYIPAEKEEATITIMHKPCRETNEEEINRLNKKVIIASVYIVKKDEYNIIVCNNNGQLFISHAALATLGFYIENPHRIIVNKEIYEEIAPEDLDLIKDLESDSCHINLIMKQIAPKRG